MNEANQNQPRHAIDPILADLWETKKQINQEAGYQIPKLVEMAHVAAVKAGKYIARKKPPESTTQA